MSPARPAEAVEPDLAETVRAAQEEMARAVVLGGLTNDPIRYTFAALSSHLAASHQIAESFRKAAGVGARGLTPEGERELIERMSDRAAYETGQAVGRFGSALKAKAIMQTAAIIVIAVGVVGSVAFLRGWQLADDRITERVNEEVKRIEGAAFMAQLAEVNDPAELRGKCDANVKQVADGYMRCTLPDVWVRAPQQQAKKAGSR